MAVPGALRLEPVFLTKVWGAEKLNHPLARVYQPMPKTGEIWLASDRHHVTPVAEGHYKGLGLDQVLELEREWILGPAPGPNFPLLLKILSVGQWLSVQVHPDDKLAQELENEPWGKSEAWYVLGAEPGAEIIMGLSAGAAACSVKQAVAGNKMLEILAKVPARTGDLFHLPAGMVHATGPGLSIFEIQQASDVTYRFWDWDRLGDDGKPRELHQEKAMQAMRISGPGQTTKPKPLSSGMTELVSDPHFSLLECRIEPMAPLSLEGGVMRVLFGLEGEARIGWGEDSEARISPGQTWLLPAGIQAWRLEGGADGAVWLESSPRP
jgi:mannose-6-phosphate isomerase